MYKKALLVIDLQKDLCYDSRRYETVKQMLCHLDRVIELFVSAGYPIYYPYFSLPQDDEQFARFGDKYCVEGTEGAEFITEILPLRGLPIKKRKHSAFFETELDELLRKDNIKELYLTGLQTQICIMTTAADASFRGYKPIVVEECVASTREIRKVEALEWIRKYVGEVITAEKLCMELGNDQTRSR